MHRQRTGGGYTVLTVGLLASLCLLALFTSPALAQDKSASMLAYESLAREFDQLRSTGVETLSPQQLADACDDLVDDLDDMIDGASADPNAKSKAQKLLYKVYGFAGMEPQSWVAYGQHLDTLESWKGQSYAIETARVDTQVNLHLGNASEAIGKCDLMVSRYEDDATRQEMQYTAGIACLRLRAHQEAVRRFNAAIAADPDGPRVGMSLRKKAYALCFGLSDASDLDAPLAVLDELAERYPTPACLGYVHYRKGRILEAQDKLLDAVAEYSKGITDQPTSSYSRWGEKRMKAVQAHLETEALEDIVKKEASDQSTPETAQEAAVVSGPVASALHHGDLGLETDPELR